MRVHQVGHGLIPGDAVSYDTLEIHRRLVAWGLEAHLFAGHVSPEYQAIAQTDDQFLPFMQAADDVVIYHYSIYDPNIHLIRAARGRKVVIYHNITPAHFFLAWDRDLAALCDAGRRALVSLGNCELALGDSDLNRQELIDLGFPAQRTAVLPIFISQQAFEESRVNSDLRDRLRADGNAVWLSVGRIVPNKAIEDVIRIFAVYHRAINPRSHLYLVGSRYVPSYDRALDGLTETLGVQESVTFTGLVSIEDLKTYYQSADLYMCASQHEGFCVPLVESMYFGLPILARKAGAVPETLGGAGVLFSRLGYAEVAEMAHLLLTDPGLRGKVIHRQRERLHELSPEQTEAQLRQVLSRLRILPADRAIDGRSKERA